MTVEQAIQAIYRQKEHDTEYPTSGDDDYTLYLALIGDAIRIWEGEKGIKWNELWVTLTDATDGTKTVAVSTLDYAMPTNFVELGAWVRTTNDNSHTFWQVMKPEETEIYKNVSESLCWVTGNASAGYTVHFGKQPTAGDTINYPYYKTATIPTQGSDVIEMSDPMFCVYYVLSVVDEENMGKWLGMANERMKAMKWVNADSPHLQPNHPSDVDAGVAGFGE